MTPEQYALRLAFSKEFKRAQTVGQDTPEGVQATTNARNMVEEYRVSRRAYENVTREDIQKRQAFVDRLRELMRTADTVCVKLPHQEHCDCCAAFFAVEELISSTEIFIAVAKNQLFGEEYVRPLREFEKD